MLRAEVVEPVVGLTPDRWEWVVMALCIVVFTCGFLITERW